MLHHFLSFTTSSWMTPTFRLALFLMAASLLSAVAIKLTVSAISAARVKAKEHSRIESIAKEWPSRDEQNPDAWLSRVLPSQDEKQLLNQRLGCLAGKDKDQDPSILLREEGRHWLEMAESLNPIQNRNTANTPAA
jgi:hypothetical protein